MMNQWL